MFSIHETLSKLKLNSSVFCSEADFQHSFAWETHQLYPKAEVHLEYNHPDIPERMYIDLWFVINSMNYAIELKYKTRKLDLADKYNICLRDQTSQDTSRYNYLKDIERLEKVVNRIPNTKGYAVMLTNDRSFWNPATTLDVTDPEFRIHEKAFISGTRSWGVKAAPGTKKDREIPIILQGEYVMTWHDYMKFSLRNGDFRYVVNEIRKITK